MVCATRTYSVLVSRRGSYGRPSSDRIRQLTAEIRRSWSPQTCSKRIAVGRNRVETLIASLFEVQSRRIG
jgi:hypothetical protein